MINPKIIYEDEDIAVIYKPAAFPSQSADITKDDVVSFLKKHISKQGIKPYVALISRLDQPVEGLMVLAKNKIAGANLSKQMQNRKIEKIYLSAIKGKIDPPSGTMEDYLVKDKHNNISRVCKKNEPGAKSARLFYETVSQMDDKSLVRIKLDTGRHHQIRVQFATRGYPLLGDRKYSRENDVASAIALCCERIIFTHPKTNKKMDYKIEPNGDIFKIFNKSIKEQ